MLAGMYYGLDDHEEMINQLSKVDMLKDYFNKLSRDYTYD